MANIEVRLLDTGAGFANDRATDADAGLSERQSEQRLLPSRVALHDQEISLSPLLAHTCTVERRKSFISTHIACDPRGGGTVFFRNRLSARWAGEC
jgi:hypothetical protein